MRNNKGLSDVVSNVLIILIVVAAVAILGLIVINLVKSAGGGVASQALCQTLDVQASCTKVADINNGTAGNQAGASATLIRGSGDSSIKITEAKINFVKTSDGTTTPVSISAVSTTALFTIGQTVSGSSEGDYSSVIPVVSGTDADGKAFTCALTQKESNCA